MKATEAKLLDFLKKSPQFVIPIYQRTYSWDESQCRQLWDDIVRTGSDERIAVHFVGSIVYIERADANVTTWEPLLVIDGQQRLTTVTLLLAALAEAVGDAEPVDGFSAEMIKGYYLQNPLERDERKFKLLLSQTDKTSLISLVSGHDLPTEHSLRIKQNYELFATWLAKNSERLEVVCKGLAKLMMVDIKLKRGEDDPQLIFESMNSTGKELSQADLIRNFILMGLNTDLQTELYSNYWRPMEVDFGQEAYGTHFDGFMRHYLTVRTGEIPNISAVYDAFKKYSRELRQDAQDDTSHVRNLVKDIREYTRFYCAMALGKESDAGLSKAFLDLRELRVDVAYPFLLELYGDYDKGILSRNDFLEIVRQTESYVFRRAICSIPTNSLNKTFSTFSKSIDKERYLESVTATFLLQPSYRRFPDDGEFQRSLKTRDLYHFPRRSYWLRRFENFGRNEYVPVDEYTIEHIMPQNENLSLAWRADLGEDWQTIQKTWLHTLGNLTLTGYNSQYSDRPFIEKRDMPGGFAQSPLKVNEGLGQVDAWNELAINERADRLAAMASVVWPLPELEEAVLDSFRPELSETPHQGVYTIDDHPNLLSPHIRPVFDALRSEILALDPCVNEEFLKLYVAYKAETNFADVVPQVQQMRISLNMRFDQISDPRGICRDISNIGRWGNGDVEFKLGSLDEIPYAIGLVRQSLGTAVGQQF